MQTENRESLRSFAIKSNFLSAYSLANSVLPLASHRFNREKTKFSWQQCKSSINYGSGRWPKGIDPFLSHQQDGFSSTKVPLLIHGIDGYPRILRS